MSSPLVLPIKILMPVPEEHKTPKYEHFVQFDPVAYYHTYHAVMDLLVVTGDTGYLLEVAG